MYNETIHITNAKQLEQTIQILEARVRVKEEDLKERFSRFPQEGLKSAASIVLPSFLTSKMAGASLSAVWSLIRIVSGNKKAILPLIGSAAKAGIFSFIKKRVQQGFNHKPEEKVLFKPTLY